MNWRIRVSCLLAAGVSLLVDVCAKDADIIGKEVVANYANLVKATYSDSLAAATKLASAVDGFAEQPTTEGFEALKKAWVAARIPFLQSEVFRFYGGPIDDEDGPEGLLNAWPMDESYIDYIEGKSASGVVANAAAYPEITAQLIRDLNEKEGETNISSGYHAIEFLLWGQDFNADGPGQRPFTDYTTAPHAERRLAYLKAGTELLVENLGSLVADWSAGQEGNYRAAFLAAPVGESLNKICVGISMLSGFELSGERLMVAYDTQEQEDEHSCFSDTTHLDTVYDAVGIQNVYLGTYGKVKGPGLKAAIAAHDAGLAQALEDKIAASIANARSIPVPFDQAILGADDAPGRKAILAAVESLEDVAQLMVQASETMGFEVPVSENE